MMSAVMSESWMLSQPSVFPRLPVLLIGRLLRAALTLNARLQIVMLGMQAPEAKQILERLNQPKLC